MERLLPWHGADDDATLGAGNRERKILFAATACRFVLDRLTKTPTLATLPVSFREPARWPEPGRGGRNRHGTKKFAITIRPAQWHGPD